VRTLLKVDAIVAGAEVFGQPGPLGTTRLQLTVKLGLRGSLAQELAQFTVEGGQPACLPDDREPVVELQGERDSVEREARAPGLGPLAGLMTGYGDAVAGEQPGHFRRVAMQGERVEAHKVHQRVARMHVVRVKQAGQRAGAALGELCQEVVLMQVSKRAGGSRRTQRRAR
jgi:hypothetical protein